MFSFFISMFITMTIMWILFKFMYPKPPKAFFPKEGDITTLRQCSYCGHALAQYRGIVEKKNTSSLPESISASSTSQSEQLASDTSAQQSVQQPASTDDKETTDIPIEVWDEWFFCNEEHQQDFHAGKVYQA